MNNDLKTKAPKTPSESGAWSFEDSYNEYHKRQNFNIKSRSKQYVSYLHDIATKMPKRAKQESFKLKDLADKYIGYMTSANFIVIKPGINNNDYLKRHNYQKECLLLLDMIDDMLWIYYDCHLITERQFEGSTKQSHYLRLSLSNWINSDEKRYNKLRSQT